MRCGRLVLIGAVAGSLAAASGAVAECGDPVDLGRGPVAVEIPAGWDGRTPAPLLLLLHGYGSSAWLQEAYMRLGPVASARGVLYAVPDGVRDPGGHRFWNATDACCDLFGSGIDDAAYLAGLIEAVAEQCPVDPWRIFLIGHSNGGFMAYRMACDHAERIAGVASLAGATYEDPSVCTPASPVHVLQIHGTRDDSIGYEGGEIRGRSYPGAEETVATWAAYSGCPGPPETLAGRLDLDRRLRGRETTRLRWGGDCEASGSAELWTIRGGAHIPALRRDFRRGVLDHLLDHPKCRGRERSARPTCDAGGRARLRLRRGVPGDRFVVIVDGVEQAAGRLDGRGRAKVPLDGLAPGRHELTLRWGCGAVARRPLSCR